MNAVLKITENEYRVQNKYGEFNILFSVASEIDGVPCEPYEKAFVFGSVEACKYAFKLIGRKPPNKYGNFFGREKAGLLGCKEIVREAM